MLFSTSVEDYLLQGAKQNEYIHASSLLEFAHYKLLTYFEVDGFIDGEPLEVKAQSTLQHYVLHKVSYQSYRTRYLV